MEKGTFTDVRDGARSQVGQVGTLALASLDEGALFTLEREGSLVLYIKEEDTYNDLDRLVSCRVRIVATWEKAPPRVVGRGRHRKVRRGAWQFRCSGVRACSPEAQANMFSLPDPE